MDTPDQNDIQQRNKALENACATLMCNIRELGAGAIPQGLIPHAPTLHSGGDLQYNHDLEAYHASLANLLAGRHAPNLRKSGATSTTPRASAPASTAPAPAVVAAAPTPLNAEEVKALTWTERVQYAGGKVTAEQLRERIAARAKAKEAAQTSQPKSSMARVLESRGVKTLGELAALPARNLD